MNPPLICDFEPADTDELLRMWRQSFESGVGIKDHHPIEEQRHYFLSEVLPKTRVQVVKQDGQILGFLAAHESYVAQLYVRVGHFGRGIGSALLGLAKEQSSGKLFLHTFSRNVRACRFYEGHGFKAVDHGFEPMWQLEDVKYCWARDPGAAQPVGRSDTQRNGPAQLIGVGRASRSHAVACASTPTLGSAMRIRPYAPADWRRLCEIHDAARKFELSAAGLSDAFLTLEQTAQAEGLFLGQLIVAEVNGEVQGFAAFSEGELTWLYVDPTIHRKGVGRFLLQHVIAACGGELNTEVLVGNEAALALYLAEGFDVQGRTDGKLAGNESFAASGYLLGRSNSDA